MFLACFCLAGCGPEERTFERQETFPVVGKVTLDGKPVKLPQQIHVRCVKIGEKLIAEGELVAVATAVAGPDGTFKLSKYESGDGVPVGQYKLLFKVCPANLLGGGRPGKDILEGKYADLESSEWTVTVTGDETEPIDVGTIDLKSDSDE